MSEWIRKIKICAVLGVCASGFVVFVQVVNIFLDEDIDFGVFIISVLLLYMFYVVTFFVIKCKIEYEKRFVADAMEVSELRKRIEVLEKIINP